MTDIIWTKITAERERQQQLFPGQTCLEMAAQGRHEECLGILVEEVGEVARALNEHRYSGAPLTDACTELVQVAAVALAWREGAGGDAVDSEQFLLAVWRHPNSDWRDTLRERSQCGPLIDLARTLGLVAEMLDRFGAPLRPHVLRDHLWRMAVVATDWACELEGSCDHVTWRPGWRPTHCGVMQEWSQ